MTTARKTARTSAEHRLENRHRLFGWSALLIWLLFGAGLELAHGFKWAPYLLDEVRRDFWSLAHFHGAVFAVVNLLYVRWAEADGLTAGQRRLASWGLLVCSVLMPLGFFLGGLVHYDGDPGVGIILSPLGAACLIAAVALQTWAAWRTTD